MSNHEDETKRAESASSGDRPLGFNCWGTDMDMSNMMAACPCSSVMRRHPVVTSAILAVMGLAALLIPTGALLGIIAFFRTI